MRAGRTKSRGGKRKKRGRPKGTGGPPELVRRNRVTTTLTDSELEALTRLADGKDLPLGTMLYELIKGRLKRRK
jgi:hypothetical protein